MGAKWNRLNNLSAVEWWLRAVLLFWLSTAFFAFLDYAGETWFGVDWPSGPDLFPNPILGLPLALIQFLTMLLLLASGFEAARAGGGVKGLALGAAIVTITGLTCFVVYLAFVLWFHTDLMGRTL